MRYFFINWVLHSDGNWTEIVHCADHLTFDNKSTSCVILDFKSNRVVKAITPNGALNPNWDIIKPYFENKYREVIQELEQANNPALK